MTFLGIVAQKFLVALVFSLVAGLLLIAVCASASAAQLGSGSDWEMTAFDREGRPVNKNCAVDRETCDAEINAIHHSWLAPELRGLYLRCDPRPGCRSAESLVIRGFND